MSPEALRDLADWIWHLTLRHSDRNQVERGNRLYAALRKEAGELRVGEYLEREELIAKVKALEERNRYLWERVRLAETTLALRASAKDGDQSD